MKNLILILAMVTFLFGCEDEERKKLLEAQICLDRLDNTATPADAQICENILAGSNTPEANYIKCAVSFIKGGVGTTRTLAALSAPSTAELIALLGMSTPAAAASTFTTCQNSGESYVTFIAGMSKIGTTISTDLGTCGPGSCSPGSCACATGMVTSCKVIGGTPCSAGAFASIGQTAEASLASFCIGDNSSSELCTAFSTAMGGVSSSDPNYYNLLGQAFVQGL